MFVTGHAGAAYLLHRATRWPLGLLLAAGIFPDLVDKPLAWLGVVSTGRALGHSLFTVALLTLLVGLVAGRRLAGAWAAGHLLHLLGDLPFSWAMPWFWPLAWGTWHNSVPGLLLGISAGQWAVDVGLTVTAVALWRCRRCSAEASCRGQPMIYLLGGAPRAGKTTAAHRFTAQTGISHFSVDYLKMGLVRGMPDYGIDVYDDAGTAVKLWPIVRGMIRTYAEEHESILLEGYYLLPVYVAELSRELAGQVRSCFLGFCETPTLQKVRQMRQHAPGGWSHGHGDWASGDDERAAAMVEHLKAVSRQIGTDCGAHGLPYVDNAGDHDGALSQVVACLTGPS